MAENHEHAAAKNGRHTLKTRVLLWIKRHKKLSIALGVLFFVLLAAGIAFAVFYTAPIEEPSVSRTNPEPPKEAPKQRYFSPLTGVELPDEAAAKRQITAVIIENTPAARPQSGLQQAELTYEGIAEAGITRFIAFYQHDKPQLIGPVRSLRPYFVDWIKPWDASIAHVGGSKRSLDEVRNGSYKDIDQMIHGDTYWRSSDRYAPHNVYTNFENIDALNASQNFTTSAPKPLKFAGVARPEQPNITQIHVNMLSPMYNSSWSYHAESNTYHRQQGGAPHVDREAGQISSNNVVVLKMPMELLHEDGTYRENYHTSGTGEGVLFQNGTGTEINWHKASPDAQLTFTKKADGKEMPLTRGKTWISAVPVNRGGGVSWE